MNLIWALADNERQALFYHMVDNAYAEDTPFNESVREAVWYNDTMFKYFNYEQFKTDLLNDGWMIVQSTKGYAVVKEEKDTKK